MVVVVLILTIVVGTSIRRVTSSLPIPKECYVKYHFNKIFTYMTVYTIFFEIKMILERIPFQLQ